MLGGSDLQSILRDLTALVGPSGFEHDVVQYIVNRVRPLVDEVRVDGIGNVIAVKRGGHPGPNLLVSTHMDEVGFVIKKIEHNGLLRFEKLGGHDDRVLLAQKVHVRTEQGVLLGVIGTISAHMAKYDDTSRVRKYSELYIDVGAKDAAEAKDMGVQIGNPVSWATAMERLGEHRVVGKGFDDRAGCAVLLSALEETDFSAVRGTLYAVFSVQEEIGLRGARVAAQNVAADVALAVDTTAVSDTPEAMMDQTLELGKGPGIKVMDFSLVASQTVKKRLVQLALKHQIPYQLEVFAGIGTDAGELVMGQSGVPSGVISIPSRYAHSPVEVMDLTDLDNAKELLRHFILALKSAAEFDFLSP